ncbi:MAG: helix-turn-helix transcriptional regulator [Actinomycetes bacterium]
MSPPRASDATPSVGNEHLARLLTMVPYLLAHQGIPVDRAAVDLGVTTTELVRDLALLFVCGTPGHLPDDLIEAEWDSGYVHLSNADPLGRPLRLDIDEAAALLVGLRILAELAGPDDREAVNRVSAKLESATAQAARDAGDRVAIALESDPEVLATARDAIEADRVVHLQYYVPTRDEVTERDVDPLRLLVVDGRTYLEAWCHRAEAVRLFRLDRVESLTVTDRPFDPGTSRLPERDLSENLYHAGPDDTEVTLLLEPGAAWVAEYYPSTERSEQADGGLLVRLRTADPAWVVRLVLSLAGQARVLGPVELVAEVREQARAAAARYGPAVGPGSTGSAPGVRPYV